jgi:hypothetical protein
MARPRLRAVQLTRRCGFIASQFCRNPPTKPMKTHYSLMPVVSFLMLTLPLAWSQTNSLEGRSASMDDFRMAEPELHNRFGLSYRMGLNITVDFKKLGGYPSVGNPGPATGSAIDRTYDNGSYNKVDISGNAGGQTWNWGYEQPVEVQGNTLILESSSSPANVTSNNRDNSPQHGLEATYMHEFYRKPHWRLGLEVGLGFTTVDVDDTKTLKGTLNHIVDAYAIPEDFVVPQAPYHGTFVGPGPLIGSNPDRTTTVTSKAVTIVGRRTFDANVYTLRLGPYVEVPLAKKLSLFLGAGLTLALGDTDFSYHETVTIEGAGSVTHSSSGSQTDFLVGGYGSGTLSYAFTPRFSLFAGGQFQAAGQSVTDTRKLGGQAETKKESILDLGQAWLVVFGAAYSF